MFGAQYKLQNWFQLLITAGGVSGTNINIDWNCRYSWCLVLSIKLYKLLKQFQLLILRWGQWHKQWLVCVYIYIYMLMGCIIDRLQKQKLCVGTWIVCFLLLVTILFLSKRSRANLFSLSLHCLNFHMLHGGSLCPTVRLGVTVNHCLWNSCLHCLLSLHCSFILFYFKFSFCNTVGLNCICPCVRIRVHACIYVCVCV